MVTKKLPLPISHQFVAKAIRAPNRSENSCSETKAAHLSGLGLVYFLGTLMFSPVFCNWSQRFSFGRQICPVSYTTCPKLAGRGWGWNLSGELFPVFQQIPSKVVLEKVGEPLMWWLPWQKQWKQPQQQDETSEICKKNLGQTRHITYNFWLTVL